MLPSVNVLTRQNKLIKAVFQDSLPPHSFGKGSGTDTMYRHFRSFRGETRQVVTYYLSYSSSDYYIFFHVCQSSNKGQ